MERFYDIPGWEGIYEINPCGKIRRIKANHSGPKPKECIKHTPSGPYKYRTVRLSNLPRREQPYVHHLVMRTFGPKKPSKLHEIDHQDRDNKNNCIENLRWVTHHENTLNRNKHGSTYNTR